MENPEPKRGGKGTTLLGYVVLTVKMQGREEGLQYEGGSVELTL